MLADEPVIQLIPAERIDSQARRYPASTIINSATAAGFTGAITIKFLPLSIQSVFTYDPTRASFGSIEDGEAPGGRKSRAKTMNEITLS